MMLSFSSKEYYIYKYDDQIYKNIIKIIIIENIFI